MGGSGPADSRDSGLFRCAPNVGFNARVEPIWHTYVRLRSGMGFMGRWRERRRLRRLIGAINGGLRGEGASPASWDERPGECVCNLRVARLGLVAEFQAYLAGSLEERGADPWPHLGALRDQGCYLLPLDFARPLSVSGEGGIPFPVASAVRAREELADVDARLHFARAFALPRMVDYLDATERDIALYESRFGTTDGFWPKFAWVLLRKLADAGVTHGMPVIFA